MSDIYSDKLPECCADCPCLDDLWFCELINEWVHKTSDGKKFDYYHDRHPSCPIKSLSVLTSKLAESEKSEETYKSMFEIGVENNHSLLKEIEQLKQQLAEKEKKIEKLKSENHALISENAYQEADVFEFNSRIEQLQKQLAEKEKVIEWQTSKIAELNGYSQALKDDLSEFQDNAQFADQDKISFAVEQLEKTRQSFIYNYNDDICCVDPYDNHCCLSLTTTIYNNTIDIFNNQIKQLKEQQK